MNDNPQQNQPPAVTPPPAQLQPQTPPPPVQLQPNSTPNGTKPKSGLPKSPYLYALLTFLLGIGIGYSLITLFPGSKTSAEQEQTAQKKEAPSLPKTAVDLKTCIAKKGNLYADPNAVPQGPIFLVNDEKIVGLEYVFSQEDFEKGKLSEELASLNMQIDHMQIASLSASYDGKPGNYFSVNLFTIDKKTKDAITCPSNPTPTIPQASPSATISTTPDISGVLLPTETPSVVPSLIISPTEASAQ